MRLLIALFGAQQDDLGLSAEEVVILHHHSPDVYPLLTRDQRARYPALRSEIASRVATLTTAMREAREAREAMMRVCRLPPHLPFWRLGMG